VREVIERVHARFERVEAFQTIWSGRKKTSRTASLWLDTPAWRYILLIHDEPPEVILSQLALVTPDPIKEKLMTAGEVLIERGRIQGERRMLLRMLTRRFGSVPAELVAQVNAADEAQIDAWADRSDAASSLAEIFIST
jgi:hypothetical protein